MRLSIILAALAALVFSNAANAAPRVSTFSLENGMEAVVIEDNRAPVVTHMVWYRAGAADEPPGKSGIAHLLEHMMFKGTDEIPEGAFSKIIAENGGRDNAFTSLDYTGYFQNIASDRLDLVMKMEADRMTDLRITEELLAPERDVVLEERNQRTENDPGSLFGEQLDAAMYQNHPYGIPVVGWKSEIEGLTLKDALDFYDRWYAPDNAILVVAGDVSVDEVKRLAEIYYGPIPARGIAQRVRPAEPPHRAARRRDRPAGSGRSRGPDGPGRRGTRGNPWRRISWPPSAALRRHAHRSREPASWPCIVSYTASAAAPFSCAVPVRQ